MTMRRVALPCLLLAFACAREDTRAPASASPPLAPIEAPAQDDPAPAHDDPAPPPTTPATSSADEPAPPVAPPASALVTIIELDAQAGPLEDQLAAIAARAKREDRPVTVEIWAGWCPPCKKLDRLLERGSVADALRGTILVRVDVDMFDDELTQLGFTSPQIPSMYRVDGRGRPRGKPLSGADWTRRDEAQIAAALRTFLRT